MAFFQENIRVIDKRWPAVGETLTAALTTGALEWVSHGAERTVLVSGIQLTSAYDRRAEASVQAELIPVTSRTATVYGFALGDLPRVLLQRPALVSLRVIIMNPELAAIGCRAADQTDWLSDPRVDVAFAWEEERICTPFAAAPTALRLAANRAAKLRDAVVLALARPFQERYFRAMDAELDARLVENMSFVEKDGDVASLFDSAEGKRVAVVAGGPTAAERFETLRAERNDCVVIAVSTALRSILSSGIVPDIVVVIDPKPEMTAHFEGIDEAMLRQVPLVYLPTVHPDVLHRWPGRRLATYIARPRFERAAKTLPKGMLFCAGSVTHAAVDLAVRMGAKEVELIGADFSFPDRLRHVEGAAEDGRIDAHEGAAHPFVLNGLGGRNPSRTDMVGFLRDLEVYIADHPSVVFRNTGRAGAVIAGAEWLDEGEACSTT